MAVVCCLTLFAWLQIGVTRWTRPEASAGGTCLISLLKCLSLLLDLFFFHLKLLLVISLCISYPCCFLCWFTLGCFLCWFTLSLFLYWFTVGSGRIVFSKVNFSYPSRPDLPVRTTWTVLPLDMKLSICGTLNRIPPHSLPLPYLIHLCVICFKPQVLQDFSLEIEPGTTVAVSSNLQCF